MFKADAPVQEYMTLTPHGIEPHETLSVARRRMQEQHIRHLPVRIGGRVVGVLTERDLYVLEAFPEVDFAKATVAFAMTPDPYCVRPTVTIREVASEMIERRIGSALVTDTNDKLLGIFTDTDALKLIAYC
jgi:acetoin utilization protein AcuB